jgi:creatinine amidohydrolase
MSVSPTIALFDRCHRDARALVREGMPVWLCVNPVEYHGPHLSLHNDRLLSLGVVRDVGARLHALHGWPVVVADHLEVGVDPCPGPGSRPVRFPVVRELVLESCRALAELGARKVVLVTFHGAPLHNVAIEAGAQWLREQGIGAVAPFHSLLQLMLAFESAEPYAAALAPLAAGDRELAAAELGHDFHAGFFETSLALHWAPESVSPIHRDLPPCPEIVPDAKLVRAAQAARAIGRDRLARELDYGARAMGWTALRPFPGYTCRPALANSESGAEFVRIVVDTFTTVIDDVLHGRADAPPPIMPWVEWMTGGGRLVHPARIAAEDILRAPE